MSKERLVLNEEITPFSFTPPPEQSKTAFGIKVVMDFSESVPEERNVTLMPGHHTVSSGRISRAGGQ